MTSMMFHRLGVRLDAIASFVRQCDNGAHKALRTYRPGDSTHPVVHQIVNRYLLSFHDRYPDPTRSWREPDEPIVPTPNDPAHYGVVQQWRLVLCLVAEATRNGQVRFSRKASLGNALRVGRFGRRAVDRLLAQYPRIGDNSLRSLVQRLSNGSTRFDMTPLVHGHLHPEAEDIDEIRYTIGRDFCVGPFRSEPQTAAQIADAMQPAAE
jgi:hypothetical protein